VKEDRYAEAAMKESLAYVAKYAFIFASSLAGVMAGAWVIGWILRASGVLPLA
jgi:hypothetical protein